MNLPNTHSCRFTPEEKAKRPHLSFIPFAWGPLNCIGMRFALLEVKMALIEILRKYKFVQAPDTEVCHMQRCIHLLSLYCHCAGYNTMSDTQAFIFTHCALCVHVCVCVCVWRMHTVKCMHVLFPLYLLLHGVYISVQQLLL